MHEITHLLDCIVNDKAVSPIGADFEDGYRAAVICDAIVDSAEQGRQMACKY
jgi:predicted dehydrogenase